MKIDKKILNQSFDLSTTDIPDIIKVSPIPNKFRDKNKLNFSRFLESKKQNKKKS